MQCLYPYIMYYASMMTAVKFPSQLPTTMTQYFDKTLSLRMSQGTNILLMRHPTPCGSHKIHCRECRWSSTCLAVVKISLSNNLARCKTVASSKATKMAWSEPKTSSQLNPSTLEPQRDLRTQRITTCNNSVARPSFQQLFPSHFEQVFGRVVQQL